MPEQEKDKSLNDRLKEVEIKKIIVETNKLELERGELERKADRVSRVVPPDSHSSDPARGNEPGPAAGPVFRLQSHVVGLGRTEGDRTLPGGVHGSRCGRPMDHRFPGNRSRGRP